MSDIFDELHYRRSLATNAPYPEISKRLSGLYEWLEQQPEAKEIIGRLAGPNIHVLHAGLSGTPPQARTPDEVAGVGVLLLREMHDQRESLTDLTKTYNIETVHATGIEPEDTIHSVIDSFIDPALDYIERELRAAHPVSLDRLVSSPPTFPLEITESLKRFREDHPDPRRVAFVMMQFGSTSRTAPLCR